MAAEEGKKTSLKTYAIIGGVVLLFIVGIAVYFYMQGAKKVNHQALPGQLPGDPNSANINGASNDEIKKLSSDLYTDMKGFNLFGHNYTPYQEASALNDTDLVKLYNTFNANYQADSKETLTQWIQGEDYRNSDYPQLLLTRFSKLNLI